MSCSPTIAIGCLGPQGAQGPTGPAGPTGPTGPTGAGNLSVSITGNTAGVPALITSGLIVLAGGPGITLSQNGSSISISAAAQSVQTQAAGAIAGTGVTTATQAGSTLGATLGTNGLSLAVPAWVTAGGGGGGGIAASIGGNTSGALAPISSGTLFLAGGNNVTLSQNGNSITISANTVAAANLSVSAGSTTGAFGGLTFGNANGFSFGLNNGTITGSYNSTQFAGTGTTFAGTNASASMTLNSNGLNLAISAAAGGSGASTGAIYFAGNTTGQSSSSNYPQSSLNISLAGILSGGWSSNSFVISAPGTTALALSAYAVSNTTQSTSGTVAGSAISFAGAGGVSVGISNGSVVISGGAGGGGGGATLSMYALGNTTQNSSTTLNQSALSFNALGAMTWGYSNGSIQVSAPATSSLSGTGLVSVSINGSTIFVGANAIPAYAVSNTTQSTSGALNGTALSFAGAGGVSVGISNGSVIISGGAGGGGVSTAGFFALGNTTQNSSTTLALSGLSFNGLGIITAGYSNGSIQLSATQSNQTLGLFAVGNTTQNSSTSRDARVVTLNGIGGISVGFSNGSVQLSAPPVSSISGTGALSVSVNGSTISLGVPGYTASYLNPTEQWAVVTGTLGNGQLFVQPMSIPVPVQFDRVVAGVYYSQAAVTATVSASASFGLYSNNASTLSLIGSTSGSITMNGSGGTASSLYIGWRGWSFGSSTTLQPGQYYLAFGSSTATAGGNVTFQNMMASQQGNTSYAGLLGQSSSASNQVTLGLGLFSTTTGVPPSSIALSAIQGTATSGLRPPSIYATFGTA
jgi:hypothetical protein